MLWLLLIAVAGLAATVGGMLWAVRQGGADRERAKRMEERADAAARQAAASLDRPRTRGALRKRLWRGRL